MAHPVEDGSGAPSSRPLIPDALSLAQDRGLKQRVFISILCLVLAIIATTYLPSSWARSPTSWPGRRRKSPWPPPLARWRRRVLAPHHDAGLAQLRDGIFAKVQYAAMREVGVKTFAHVQYPVAAFPYLERKTGGLSRVIERGTKGIDTLLSFALFSIFPTLFQLLLFSAIMVAKLDWVIAAGHAWPWWRPITWFTFAITRWRIAFRREMNQSDTDANTKAVDSLLNYETVKYFNNEGHETQRFDRSMERYARASIQSQTSLRCSTPARPSSSRWAWAR